MSYLNDNFVELYSKLYHCLDDDTTSQLDIYPQLKSLYNYFDHCIFSDPDLQDGRTYIFPMDVEVDLFDETDYMAFTDPNDEEYDSDLATFVDSHNKLIRRGFVSITLKAGTQFIYNDGGANPGCELIIDGYPLEWYDYIISNNTGGAVPYLIEA